MPISKSAKKSLRQSWKRRARNLVYKNRVKKLEIQIRRLLNDKKFAQAKTILPQTFKALDKAAKQGVIKKNKANRKKSRINKLVANG